MAAKTVVLDEEIIQSLIKRINRAQGQLGAVSRMLESGRSCEEIITQMSAASKAINTAAVTLISSNLEKCIIEGKSVEKSEKLQKLFLTLA